MTTITNEVFNELVSDFEYGIIDEITIGNSTIQWQPEDETCFKIIDGKVVSTGCFEHLLEWFLEEVA